MRPNGISRSSLTINSIWKVRGRRPTLRRTCKVYTPRDLRQLDTLHIPATYEEDNYIVQKLKTFTKHKIHHFILVCAISFYLYTGALLFQYLETKCKIQVPLNISQVRQELLTNLIAWKNQDNWERELETAVELFELKVLELKANGNSSSVENSDGWTIEEAIFYCFTVITTIGESNI